MKGSDDNGQPLDGLRARQENELAVSYALATMEFALAQEAYHVGATLRDAGLAFDPLTFVALRILEAGADELVDPADLLGALCDNGTLDRSVELATDLLEDEAA